MVRALRRLRGAVRVLAAAAVALVRRPVLRALRALMAGRRLVLLLIFSRFKTRNDA